MASLLNSPPPSKNTTGISIFIRSSPRLAGRRLLLYLKAEWGNILIRQRGRERDFLPILSIGSGAGSYGNVIFEEM
jgi:hypothetical protein